MQNIIKIIITTIFAITLTSCLDEFSKKTNSLIGNTINKTDEFIRKTLPKEYKTDLRQGSEMDEKKVSKLKLGMSKSEVKRVFGSPDIIDPFHKNRWDYVNTSRINNKTIDKSLTLFFDENNTLKDGEYKWKD
jgi:outer membrane protein assembly factor BamE (lipoprotein component of BamABCDE complex)